MTKEEHISIEIQKAEIFENTCGVDLLAPCEIGYGILSGAKMKELFHSTSERDKHNSLSFFVPASGSGSRMFSFLYEFVETGIETEDVTSFFNSIEKLPFYSNLKSKIEECDNDKMEIASFILNDSGLGYGNLPKGMIPFHVTKNFVYNPFQEQYLQAKEVIEEKGGIHFTVQEKFQKIISESIQEVSEKEMKDVSFSFQLESTDAYCFRENGDVIQQNGNYLRRPAGHGALLENLNQLSSSEVLIKNIDNVQPFGGHQITNEYWMTALSILHHFKNELNTLRDNFSVKGLVELNESYEFLHPSQLENFTHSDVESLFNRPTRVCGMVKNTGKPGGGPFWIKDGNHFSKQIVEKSQVLESEKQQDIFNQGTHFNPVFIAASITDLDGAKMNLHDFVDHTKCIVVTKLHEGQLVKYRELPGLWNGSMAKWNTIFIEVPDAVFSPVKTVLDLLDPPHLI